MSTFSLSSREKIHRNYGGKCVHCGVSIKVKAMHVDHLHARALGGGNDRENLAASCVRCNILKRDRTIEEFHTYIEEKWAEESAKYEHLKRLWWKINGVEE